MSESDLSARKNFFFQFFWNRPFWTSDGRQNMWKKKFEPGGSFRTFFRFFFFRKLSSNMGIKQLRLTFLRTRIPSKKCPKVTFWLEKSFTRTVSMDPIKCNGDFDNFLVENPPFFLIYILKDPPLLRSFSCQNHGRRWKLGGNYEKLIKKTQ